MKQVFSKACQTKAFYIIKLLNARGQDPKMPMDLTDVNGINDWLRKALNLNRCKIAETNKEFLALSYEQINERFKKLFLASDLANI
jgi:hypothetical protein